MSTWDKEAVYDNEISVHVARIIEICQREDIPLLLSVQYADTEDLGPCFCSTALLPEHAAGALRRALRQLQISPRTLLDSVVVGEVAS